MSWGWRLPFLFALPARPGRPLPPGPAGRDSRLRGRHPPTTPPPRAVLGPRTERSAPGSSWSASSPVRSTCGSSSSRRYLADDGLARAVDGAGMLRGRDAGRGRRRSRAGGALGPDRPPGSWWPALRPCAWFPLPLFAAATNGSTVLLLLADVVLGAVLGTLVVVPTSPSGCPSPSAPPGSRWAQAGRRCSSVARRLWWAASCIEVVPSSASPCSWSRWVRQRCSWCSGPRRPPGPCPCPSHPKGWGSTRPG